MEISKYCNIGNIYTSFMYIYIYIYIWKLDEGDEQKLLSFMHVLHEYNKKSVWKSVWNSEIV